MRVKAPLVLLSIMASMNLYSLAQPVNSPRVITVSKNPSDGAQATSLRQALSLICPYPCQQPPGPNNPAVVLVYPGIYTGPDNGGGFFPWPSYVALRGLDRDATIVRGSANYGLDNPMIDMTNAQGVEVSNITLDGSENIAMNSEPWSSAVNVCGAKVKFDNVRCENGTALWAPGPCATTDNGNGHQVSYSATCTTAGEISFRNSELDPIWDFGGTWTISNSILHGSNDNVPHGPTDSPQMVFAYIRTLTEFSPTIGNKVTISGSAIMATGNRTDLDSVVGLYVEAGPGEIEVVGSTIIATTTVMSPAYRTAGVIMSDGLSASGLIQIQGTLLQYESPNGVTSGSFNGIFSDDLASPQLSRINVHGSVIRSVGTGGTRADVYRNANAAMMTVGGTEYLSVAGVGANGITSTDFRQGRFSTDLTVPLTPPSAQVPADGQMWIDAATNRLCFQSSGTTRCVTGT